MDARGSLCLRIPNHREDGSAFPGANGVPCVETAGMPAPLRRTSRWVAGTTSGSGGDRPEGPRIWWVCGNSRVKACLAGWERCSAGNEMLSPGGLELREPVTCFTDSDRFSTLGSGVPEGGAALRRFSCYPEVRPGAAVSGEPQRGCFASLVHGLGLSRGPGGPQRPLGSGPKRSRGGVPARS